MSDERLRRLERRWREAGDPVAEAAYQLERVRQGQLAPSATALVVARAEGRLPGERLLLLAYAGHPDARAIALDDVVELAAYLGDLGAVRVVLGDEADDPDREAWLHGLAHWSREASLRALTAAARAQLRAPRLEPREDEAEPRVNEEWFGVEDLESPWRQRDRATVAELLAGLEAWSRDPSGAAPETGPARQVVDELEGAFRPAALSAIAAAELALATSRRARADVVRAWLAPWHGLPADLHEAARVALWTWLLPDGAPRP